MGEQRVSIVKDQGQMQKFVRSLLKDVQALDYMLKNNWFESGIKRIGAEQEMCIVNKKTYKPAPINMSVLETMTDYEWVETELARFNLETNLTPREFTKDCLKALEKENLDTYNKIKAKVKPFDAELILTGILPTIHRHDMEMHNLTPKKRYKALMESINAQLIGSAYELRIVGIDELMLKHASPLLEACNTSFQVHLQVSPENFVKYYNIAQTLAAPTMAMAANSPLVFGRRLWHESRIALFQQSLDTRTTHEHMRQRSPRVSFGNDWLHESVLEIYKEDISRFRVLLSSDIEEDSLEMIQDGKVPKLRALQVHNSTVYRWNRPCYGISPNGQPHLRIENRVLPAGPTILDATANAAFWLGAMIGMAEEVEDIRDHLSFADIRDNFGKAAQYGIDTEFTWFDDKKWGACDLVLEKLLPLARKGLKSRNIDPKDIDRYLNVIEERAKTHMNGARWQLRAYTHLLKETTQDEALAIMTASMIKNQALEKPVHTWEMPSRADLESYRPSSLKVEEFMQTDLFTVQKDDIIELVTEIMAWRKVRYLPVEDNKGHLVGLVSTRSLLHHYSRVDSPITPDENSPTVKDIMITDPITINASATVIEAMYLMRQNKIGCLPVVKNKELIGVITEMDFLKITGRLMETIEKK